MCILLLTTHHPSYALILLSNRDEYLSRPTAGAGWWKGDIEVSTTSLPSSESSQVPTQNGDSTTADGPKPQDILSGRDLRHPSQGTWLGGTKSGRIAALTNFREEGEESQYQGQNKSKSQSQGQHEVNGNSAGPVDDGYTKTESKETGSRQEQAQGKREAASRGQIPKAYLSSHAPPEEWAEQFIAAMQRGEWGDVGGFSLIFGQLRGTRSNRYGDGQGGVKAQLAVLDNRTKSLDEVKWIAGTPFDKHKGSNGVTKEHVGKEQENGTTGFACALSNSHYGTTTWPKVLLGEKLLKSAVSTSIDPKQGKGIEEDQGKSHLLDQGFNILSTNTMPPRAPEQEWASYAGKLRESIFIPRITAGGDSYGTQKQTVVLVDKKGVVEFVERTLWGGDGRGEAVPANERERRYEFELDNR